MRIQIQTPATREPAPYLSKDTSLPDNIGMLQNEFWTQFSRNKVSSMSAGQLRTLLLDGAAISKYTAADICPLGDCPEPPASPRTREEILEHLECLLMPANQPIAREELRLSLDIDGIDDGADILARLENQNPEAVTAFLRLEIDKGRSLVGRKDPFGLLAPSDKQLVTVLVAVRYVFMLRKAAMVCGAQLRRPTGMEPLDRTNNTCAARFGPLLSNLRTEMGIVQGVIALSLSGGKTLKPLGVKAIRFLRETEIERRARVQLALWRCQHGNQLEVLLIRQLRWMQKTLRKLDRKLTRFEAETQYNTRLGNSWGAAPLAVLYNLVRYVAAIMLNVDAGDHATDSGAQTIQPRGLEAIVDWSMNPQKQRGAFPYPHLHRRLRNKVNDVFATLRYAIVEDDQMFPKAAKERVELAGKVVELESQTSRVNAGLSRLTFSELRDAYDQASGETAVARHADVKARKLSAFSEPVRDGLQPYLDWVLREL